MVQQARYEVRLYDPASGLLMAIFDAWDKLHYEKIFNDVAPYTFELPSTDPRVALFKLDAIFEVWRTPDGGDRYLEYTGFHRSPEFTIKNSRQTFLSTGESLLSLISRKCIMYPSVSAYTLKSGPGESVIKSYVDENAGPGASAALRVVSGVTPGLTIAPDAAQGDFWFGDRAFIRLLDVIKEVSLTTRIDFDVVRTGPLTFEFRTYFPQLGIDRRANIIFAPNLGNMDNPSYSIERKGETTIAVALGQGTGVSRQRVAVTSAAATDSQWNRIEAVQEAGSEDTYSGLLAAANKMIVDNGAKESFTFDIMPAATLYGRDFFHGDIVTARFNDITRATKIIGVSVDVAAGTEKIGFTFGQLATPGIPVP